MKRVILSAFLLCLSAAGQAITANSIVTNTLMIQPAGAPPAVTATLIQSQPGTATYYYWVVSTNSVGSTLAGPFPIFNAPATLSATANVAAFWVPSSGVTYSLLRTNTTASPSGACNCAVSVAAASSYITDTGMLSAYTLPSLLTPSSIGPGPAITPTSIEGVLYADQFVGDGWVTKLEAAMATLGASGGTVVFSGLGGNQTEPTAGDLDLTANNISVRFGPGNYTVNGNIVVSGSNDAIFCDPHATITLVDNGSAASHTLQFNGVGQSIVGCTVTQSNVTGRTGFYGTISSFAATNLTISHVAVTGGSSTGIFVAGVLPGTTIPASNSGLHMSDVTVSGTEADGIMFSRGVTNATLSGITATNTGDDGLSMISIITDDGTHDYAPNSDISVTGAVLSSNGTGPAGRGLAILGGHDIAISNVVISSPINQGLAIEAQAGNTSGASTYYPYHITASNVTVFNTGAGAGATLGCGGLIEDARDITLSGFTSRVTTLPAGSNADGLCILGVAKDVVVSGFQSSQAAGAGIAIVQTSSTEARILQELWTNLGDTPPSTAGMSNVSINGAIIRNAAGAGINVRGQSTLHISGITIENPQVYNVASGQYGISLVFTDNSAIIGGLVAGGATKGSVTLNSDTGAVVASSTLLSPTDGIDVVACTSCSINDNVLTGGSGSGVGLFIDSTGADNTAYQNTISGFTGGSVLNQDVTSVVVSNPADSGTLALTGANGTSAGTITITAGTSGAHTFATSYALIPFCTASLESSPPATAISFSIVASTTGVTITSATSITGTFSWICTPAAN